MTGNRAGIFSIFLVLVASWTGAYGITISASVDKDRVELGDQVNLSIVIGGTGNPIPEPVLPDLKDFDVYSSGRKTSISFSFGASSSTLELNYTLVPKKMGQLTIGPVTVKDGNSSASSSPISIMVSKPGTLSRQPVPPPSSSRRKANDQAKDDFFIEQTVDKPSPYVGEQVTLIFRFYQGANLMDNPATEWPEYNGFAVEDLPPVSRSRQYIDGRIYMITEIKRALFPVSSGTIVIDSPRLTVRRDEFGNIMDPFDLFRRNFPGRSEPIVLTARSITLRVKALPENGKPAGFEGAVGNYNISATVDKDSVSVDEPVTLKVVLSGTGDIKSLSPIKFPDFSDFRVYESGQNESINQGSGRISGSKTFEMALIPKTSGEFEIPSLSYSFFDPSKAQYEILRTKPIKIFATGEGLADVGSTPVNVIESSKKSFGYIITAFPKEGSDIDLASSRWFWFLQVIPVLGIFAGLIFRSHYRKLHGDKTYARRVTAGRRSRTIFRASVARMKSGDYSGFCGGLYDAILGFVSDRLGLPKAGLTIDDLRRVEQVPSELRDQLVRFLDLCQSARFSKSDLDRNRAEEMYRNAASLISRLEKAL